MVFILVVLAVCEILFGLAVFVSSKNAVHEILAAVLIGSGIVTVALATVVNELRELNDNVTRGR